MTAVSNSAFRQAPGTQSGAASKKAPVDASSAISRSAEITSLENSSNKNGIKGKVKNNGGDPDGKLGKNDLEAIVKNGKQNGVSDGDVKIAQDWLNNFDQMATSFGKDKYIVA